MQNIRYLCILMTIIPYERRSMQLYWLSDTIGVSDQISPEDVLELSSLGVKSIICNRPDRESESLLILQKQPVLQPIKIIVVRWVKMFQVMDMK